MKKEWKNIEGRLARIDVGSSLSEAMGSTFPAEAICFTTDGNIVFNGIQYSLSQDEYNTLVESIKANTDTAETNAEAIATIVENLTAAATSIQANTEAIAKKVDKKEGYDLASLDQLRAAQWCSEHVLSDNTATSFLKVQEDGKNGYKFNHLVDGETYNSTSQYIPVATDSTSGVMSASDHSNFTETLEDIDTLFSELGSHDKAITDNTTSIQANTEAIAKKVDKKEGYDLASLDQLRAAQWCSEHVLSDNTATSFLKVQEDGKNGYKFNHLVDGETYNSTSQYIPVATDSTSGVMSASDHSNFTETLEDIDTLFSELGSHDKAITDNTASIQANTEAIAKNATDIKACQDSIVNNAKSVPQISTSLVLPISGTTPFRITVEGIAKDAQWNEAYGNLPQYSSALNAFFISSGLKNYVAWAGFTDIPDSGCYGSTKTLYYDGEKLYRYTGKELVELTTSTPSDTTALEERVKTLETQLASVISLLTLQQ